MTDKIAVLFLCTPLALTVLASPHFSMAVTVSGEVDNHRVAQAVLTHGVNLDGVVRLQLDRGTGCNAALITDRHLLSAAHCFDSDDNGTVDADSSTVFVSVFERPSGTLKMRFRGTDVTLPENWRKRHADISIIQLASDAPLDIPRYPTYGRTDEIGRTVVIVGYGFTGTGAEGRTVFLDEKLAGLNRYEAVGEDTDGSRGPLPVGATLAYDFDSGEQANNTLAAMGFASDLGFGHDEVKSAKGDSGAPVFIDGAIAGVVSFGDSGFATDLLPDVTDTWGELNFDTRVSTFREFVLTATDGQAVVTPEPSGLVLLLSGWLALLSRCVRRSVAR